MKTLFSLSLILTIKLCFGQVKKEYFIPADSNGTIHYNSNSEKFVTDREGNNFCAVSFFEIMFQQDISAFNTDTFSISFWYREADYSNKNTSILMDMFYGVRVSPKCVARYTPVITKVNSDSVSLFNRSKAKIIHGWNHIAWTYQNGTSNFYVNGIGGEEFYYLFEHKTISKGNSICDGGDPTFHFYNSMLDDIREFNYELTSEEVEELYKAPASCSSVTGLEPESSNKENFTLYPNPSTGTFIINSNEPVLYHNVYDLSGNKILSTVHSAITGLAKGTYVVVSYQESRVIKTKVVVK